MPRRSLRTPARIPTFPGLVSSRLAGLAGALTVALAVSSTTQATRVQAQEPLRVSDVTAASARKLLDQYCVACHNEKSRSGGLTLSTIDPGHPGDNAEVWEKVVRKLRARYMPPAGRPRPDEATYNALVSYVETTLDAAAAAQPDPGRTDVFHRLNRTEYQNSIRDLLALDVDMAALLPKDEASHGFDNVSPGGVSPTLLERYVSAAQKVSRLAVGSPVRSPASEVVVLPPDLTQEEHVESLPLGTRGGTSVSRNFPRDGEYEIQLRLTRDRNGNIEGLTEPHELEITLDGVRLSRFEIKPQKRGGNSDLEKAMSVQDQADAGLTVRVPLKSGPHEVGVAFLKNPWVLLETERQPYQAHFNFDRHPRPQPALYSLSIVGPFSPTGVGDTPSRQRIFSCLPAKASDEELCARKILSTLIRKAYRGPAVDSDVESALAFYSEGHVEGGFEGGIELAIRAILVNPKFLLRVEKDPSNLPSNAIYRIPDLALASRLSFFLWSSIPDDSLLELASSDKLHEPAVLSQQVKRMLADSRADVFISNFADQWLYLRNLASVAPDPRLFPDFDDNLRQAFRVESELFFASIVKEDLSVLDLLQGKYTYLNERLAKHYGVPNIYGSRFRRVTFDDSSVRGGLLGQGSILTVTSYGNRTSPVLRGKWVLENILGTAPPPPPPNVPPLAENNDGGKVLSMRERMAQHRSNPVCASCHQLMDPIGFATENFDAIGRWRLRDEGGARIDASGSLPDGAAFSGMAGMRDAFIKRPEIFVSTLTEKLLTYALGRGLESYDSPAVRGVVQSARSHDYRFSSLIEGIVNSTPFLMRRSH